MCEGLGDFVSRARCFGAESVRCLRVRVGLGAGRGAVKNRLYSVMYELKLMSTRNSESGVRRESWGVVSGLLRNPVA